MIHYITNDIAHWNPLSDQITDITVVIRINIFQSVHNHGINLHQLYIGYHAVPYILETDAVNI